MCRQRDAAARSTLVASSALFTSTRTAIYKKAVSVFRFVVSDFYLTSSFYYITIGYIVGVFSRS